MIAAVLLPGGQTLSFADAPLVMGIINATPDSFSDGGAYRSVEDAVDHALRMVGDGASMIDIGGESTRPGSLPVSAAEELDRVMPVIEGIRRRSPVVISIDTTKAEVARHALAAGASVVNDVSALRFDDELASVIRSAEAGVILMHMRGEPRTMQQSIHFRDVVAEVKDELLARVQFATSSGIDPGRIMIDPGIGFGKTFEQNLELIRNTDVFTGIAPVVVGASRKAFLGAITGQSTPRERTAGSIAAAAAAAERGAAIVRVHDVRETVDFLKVRKAINGETK